MTGRFLDSRCWWDIVGFLYGGKLAAICFMVFIAPWTWTDFLDAEL